MFRPQESYIENTSTGQRIPLSRRGVFVVQLDAQVGSRTTNPLVRFDQPNRLERTPVFRRPA